MYLDLFPINQLTADFNRRRSARRKIPSKSSNESSPAGKNSKKLTGEGKAKRSKSLSGKSKKKKQSEENNYYGYFVDEHQTSTASSSSITDDISIFRDKPNGYLTKNRPTLSKSASFHVKKTFDEKSIVSSMSRTSSYASEFSSSYFNTLSR